MREQDDVGRQGEGRNKTHEKPNANQSYVKNSDVHDKQVITSEAEMYIMSSMGGRSLGKGNRF